MCSVSRTAMSKLGHFLIYSHEVLKVRHIIYITGLGQRLGLDLGQKLGLELGQSLRLGQRLGLDLG